MHTCKFYKRWNENFTAALNVVCTSVHCRHRHSSSVEEGVNKPVHLHIGILRFRLSELLYRIPQKDQPKQHRLLF